MSNKKITRENNNILLIKNIINVEELNEYIEDESILIVPKEIDTIKFKRCTFNRNFNISKIKNKNNGLSIIFNDCSFNEDFILEFPRDEDTKVKKLSLIAKDKKKLTNIILKNFSVDKLFLKNYDIDKLDIFNLDFAEDSRILFENLIIKDCSIQRISQDSKYMQFHTVKILEKFKSERVEFKNTYFNDFDLRDASIELIKTSFLNSHLNSVEWGNLSRIKAKKDTLRQLKFVNDSIGNYIEGNNFFAQEMRIHQLELRKKKKFHLEKITLFFNSEISNFGQNWFQSLLWIIIITFLLLISSKFNTNPIMVYIFIGLILFLSTFRLVDYLNNSSSNNFRIFSLPIFCTIIYYLNLESSFHNLSVLLSIKAPPQDDNLFMYWVWHKVLIAFPLYHFTISLRRLTRR